MEVLQEMKQRGKMLECKWDKIKVEYEIICRSNWSCDSGSEEEQRRWMGQENKEWNHWKCVVQGTGKDSFQRTMIGISVMMVMFEEQHCEWACYCNQIEDVQSAHSTLEIAWEFMRVIYLVHTTRHNPL